MNTTLQEGTDRQGYYRLIALWAICEAWAGGLMHGARIPFTGLLVSGMAVTCIILIAYHRPEPAGILRATILVAFFKLMLSPHSPPTAYIAVFFQGMLGQLLFRNRKYFLAKAIILGVLALVESAGQRILVLWVLFGNSFWDAVNQFIQKLTGDKDMTDYSKMIALVYIAIHAIAGLLIGIYASRLASRVDGWKKEYGHHFQEPGPAEDETAVPRKKRKGIMKVIFLLIWSILALALIFPNSFFLPSTDAAFILLRSIVLLGAWFFVVKPLFMMAFRKWMNKKGVKYQQDIEQIRLWLPRTRQVFLHSWRISGSQEGIARVRLFSKMLIAGIL
ncbi:MAG TPA: hypothetical protein DCQ34_04105 [Chitinophagaceae bacterium]|nr:hypothetical protein [Chitinophagaceae bacterium]